MNQEPTFNTENWCIFFVKQGTILKYYASQLKETHLSFALDTNTFLFCLLLQLLITLDTAQEVQAAAWVFNVLNSDVNFFGDNAISARKDKNYQYYVITTKKAFPYQKQMTKLGLKKETASITKKKKTRTNYPHNYMSLFKICITLK